MATPSLHPQEYYAHPGLMTDPGQHADLFAGLPISIAELCQVVQDNLIHIFWAERYGRQLSEEEKQAVNVRPVSQKMALIKATHPAPLAVPRPLQQRQVGNCRDFSVLLCALLQHHGVPARARCGFGAYFWPGHYEDHWVCEYWNAAQERWVLVDAQLDPFQQETLQLQFDPLDVPRDQFIVGGQAWQMCRAGQADPQCFGIFDMHGWWFIWGNVMREFYALNKLEILPWDGGWGFLNHNLDDPLLPEPELAEYDRLAALTLAGDTALAELRTLYERDTRFAVPAELLPLG